MKSILTATLLTLAILWPAHVVRAAEQRMATLNVEKVFSGYWRTAKEDERLKKELEAVTKRSDEEDKKQAELLKELQNMAKVLQSPNLRQADRARHQQQLQAKQKVFEQNRGTLNRWKAAKQKELDEKRREAFKKIREDVLAVVSAQAKKNGYTYVVDSKALLYSDGELDITNQVLAQLNINDPDKAGKVEPPKKQ